MTVETIADGLGFTEGPAYLPDGRVALVSVTHGCVYIVDPAGGSPERIDTGGGPNGLCVGSDGSIFVAQNGGSFGSDATEPGVQVIRDGRVDYLAEGMDAPNDLAFGPDGRLWVTDTRAEMELFHPDQSKRGWLWTVDADTGAKDLILENGPVWINGLGFSPDWRRLLVTATSGAQLVRYPIGATGSLDGTAGDVLCTFERGWPAGMAVRADGACWVALTGGDRLDLVGETGRILDAIVLPGGSLPTNVCVRQGRDELLVTASYRQALLRIRLPSPV
ncbi:hypothetical protein A5696_25565 [Mycobacterium sp. E2699]|uniref:SMP-30/gluconolactonase/LRE family protein n=1 Tax=Mycobacterium sp. E2699 TaxID=1834137 RepID=UPI0008019BA7|nr:SMP-30/gluconolactonase/LRE family protein [Mycobacterium sp. E2699]OBH05439.1 hypothetical protein A5696_25565 [Mycobacterium sp. E2699]